MAVTRTKLKPRPREEEEEEVVEEEEQEEEETPEEEEEAPEEQEEEQSADDDEEQEEEKPKSKPKLTPAEKRALFTKYQEIQDEVDEIKEALEAANERLRKSVLKIAKNCGEGPFGWKGQQLTVVRRTNKKTGVTNCYFRGKSNEAEEIG